MLFELLLYLILFMVLLVGYIDIFPLVNDWVQRIKIGRFKDKILWNHKISNMGIRWLLKTPKIRITDNTRLIAIDILKRNYSSRAIQDWQEAALLLGLTETFRLKNDGEIKKEILEYINLKFDRNGHWLNKPKHVDAAILAYAVMKIDFIDTEKYKCAFDATWKMIKDHIGEDGTVEYRKFMKSYRYVDTIGFVCPFLITYGVRFNKEECIELGIRQIKEYVKYGMLKEHFIPSHVYKIDNNVPLGLYGWGRGLGWFAIGLIDSWSELPLGHKYKDDLEEIIIKFAKASVSFQQQNGSWNWTVTREETRSDSSTTATLCWFLLNAARINVITDDCLESTDKALNYLMSVTRKSGAVDFSQGDTKDIGVYSSLFNILPFTQGFSIRTINYYIINILKKEENQKRVS
ncbi:glycoside hydrolase family 88 protein [Litchfieldia salsa]|uniref:glycoside hydrolase family 88 protein n=1 Tax=Litchfieldia salsa TaxID=930152 RepID=UPI00361E996E